MVGRSGDLDRLVRVERRTVMDHRPIAPQVILRYAIGTMERLPSREGDDFDAAPHLELAEDAVNVILHGRALDAERRTDLLVR